MSPNHRPHSTAWWSPTCPVILNSKQLHTCLNSLPGETSIQRTIGVPMRFQTCRVDSHEEVVPVGHNVGMVQALGLLKIERWRGMSSIYSMTSWLLFFVCRVTSVPGGLLLCFEFPTSQERNFLIGRFLLLNAKCSSMSNMFRKIWKQCTWSTCRSIIFNIQLTHQQLYSEHF